MKNYAEQLARDYDLGTSENDFYNYIVESLINGNRDQVRSLFNELQKADKQTFLIDYLNPSKGIEKSVLNICIIELLK